MLRKPGWRRLAGHLLPRGLRKRLRYPGFLIRWGTLRRTYLAGRSRRGPRGSQVDRYYGERFLTYQAGAQGYLAGDFHGRILEFGEAGLASWLGIEPEATVVELDQLQPDFYDCVLVGSSLYGIVHLEEALARLAGILRPGGVMLAVLPGIAQRYDPGAPTWGFTPLAARRTFESAFSAAAVTVHGFGNVLTATALLHGIPADGLRSEELDLHDPEYPAVIAVRAIRAQATESGTAGESKGQPRAHSRRAKRSRVPAPSGIRLGSFRRSTPISRTFGADRGTPLDRHYIESFLGTRACDVQGDVLEFGESVYSRRYGDGKARIAVADPDPNHPEASVTVDLASRRNPPASRYDCIICTQVLLLIYDVRNALRVLHQLLAPGGVVLVTVPGISQVCRPDIDLWGDYWRFSAPLMRGLLEEIFPPESVSVRSYGNLLSATAVLYGLAEHELRRRDVEYHDPSYVVTLGARAVKDSG